MVNNGVCDYPGSSRHYSADAKSDDLGDSSDGDRHVFNHDDSYNGHRY